MESVPPTMRAWSYSSSGTPRQVLRLNDIPSPKPPKGDQILIKVAYSGLNPGDTKIMRMLPSFMRPKNSVPGADYSGTIVSLGPSAPSHLTVGMKVFGMLDVGAILSGQGTLAEYICISSKKDMVAAVPDNIPMADAGGLGIASMMAWLSCKKAGMVDREMKRVLINGGSGGCGAAMVQVVKALGAKEVVATCSGPNEELVRSLGASKTIDYKKHAPLHEHLAKEYSDRPFDTIIDIVGDQILYTNSPKYLEEGSTFVNIGDFVHGTFWTALYWFSNSWWPTWLGGTPRKYAMFSGYVDAEGVERVGKWLEEEKLRAIIEKCVDFQEVLDALDLVTTRRVRGRVVVKVADTNT